MSLQQVKFQFPDKEDFERLKKIQSYEQLKQLILTLKRSPKYSYHRIIHVIREWSKEQSGITYNNLSVYFSCCKSKFLRPAIHYLSVNGSQFRLQKKSSYLHCHMQKRRKKNKKNISQMVQKDNKIQTVGEKNYDPKQEDPRCRQKLIQQFQVNDQSESQQILHQQKRQIPIQKKVFIYPSAHHLKKISTITSQRSLLSFLRNFIRQDEFKYLGIRCESQTYKQKNNFNQIIEHFIVGFKCCIGMKNQRPYLHYVKKETGGFHLLSYNNYHDHINFSASKIMRTDKKLMTNLRNQILSKYRISEKNKRVENTKITKSQFFIDEKMHNQNQFIHDNPSSIVNSCQDNLYQNSFLMKNTQSQFKKASIFNQLQIYSQKLSKYVIQKQLNLQKQTLFSSKEEKNSLKKVQFTVNLDENKQLWRDCIFEMLDLNGIDILEMFDIKEFSKDKVSCEFKNLIFLRNTQNQQEKKFSRKIDIFLAVYPIKIATLPYELTVLIAYCLTSQSHPKLLWFHLSEKEQESFGLENMLSQNLEPQILEKVFKQAIKHFQLTEVNYIYTTLDYQLIKNLDNIFQFEQIKFSKEKNTSTMHFQCLKTLINVQNSDKNFLLQNEIKSRIQRSLNFHIIKSSYKILRNLLKKNPNKNVIENSGLINPRLIFKHFRTFADPFTNQNENEKLENYSSSFLLCDFQDQNISVYVENPISQINSIFTRNNRFNHIEEVFVLIIQAFDLKFRKLTQRLRKSQVIPSQTYEILKQFQIFKQMYSYHIEFKYNIQRIFNEPAYQMLLIVKSCPRFITQIIYRLIIPANKLEIKKQYKSFGFPQQTYTKFYIHHEILHTEKSYQVSSIQNKQKRASKKWLCSCNFYMETGIPCEHEILAALKNKDSLFEEIHVSWKIINQEC